MVDIPFPIERPYGRVDVVLEVYEDEDTGAIVCGLRKLEGSISLPPKVKLRVIREEIGRIEGIARRAGCTEMRHAGRDWSRLLPDYEPMPGHRNGLRKVL